MRIEFDEKKIFNILKDVSNSDGRGGIGRSGEIKFNILFDNGGKYIYLYTAEYDEDGDEVHDTRKELIFIALDESKSIQKSYFI